MGWLESGEDEGEGGYNNLGMVGVGVGRETGDEAFGDGVGGLVGAKRGLALFLEEGLSDIR